MNCLDTVFKRKRLKLLSLSLKYVPYLDVETQSYASLSISVLVSSWL